MKITACGLGHHRILLVIAVVALVACEASDFETKARIVDLRADKVIVTESTNCARDSEQNIDCVTGPGREEALQGCAMHGRIARYVGPEESCRDQRCTTVGSGAYATTTCQRTNCETHHIFACVRASRR